jgi:hypothetical protein
VTGLRKAALAAIAVLVAAASLVSFAESYRALYLWAAGHGLRGVWAYSWPLQVDTFVAVGELALLVALADSWPVRSRVAAWGVTVLGLGVSVAGNVGHVAGRDLASQATAAVPPLAAAAALAVGLGVLKRVVSHLPVTKTAPGGGFRDAGSDSAGAPVPAVPGPEIRQHLADLAVPETREPRTDLAALNGHASAAAELFAGQLASGQVPSIRAIRSGLSVGQQKASEIQAHLRTLTAPR